MINYGHSDSSDIRLCRYACPVISGLAPCGGHSIRRWMRHCARTGGRHDGETAGQLPVAAAQRDGRARHVHHHRAGAAARRPGHHAVGLPGAPPGHRHPGTAGTPGAGRVVRHPGGDSRRADRDQGAERRAAQGRRRRRPGGRRRRRHPAAPRPAAPRAVTSAGCTPEQYQRWHVRDCARCGRRAGLAANWPDGPVCRTCHRRAARTYGNCPACGTRRLLPGRRSDGEPICRDCAGITRDVSAPLAPLLEALAAMQTPDTGLTWIAAAHVRGLLSDLATGKVALTHQALAAQPHWRAVAHLRDLLMSCGVLPAADKQLLHFETWLHRHLAGAPAGPGTRLLLQYATWHQLPRLRAKAAARPLTPAACANAIRQVKAAARFLAWLREYDPGPDRLSQAGIDTWHATCGQGDRASARPFLTWAIKTGQLPRLTLPPVKAPPGGTPITQQRRLSLLRRALTSDQAPVRTRAAACLTLLFAQPPARIVRLTIYDIIRGDYGQILLRLVAPPAPLPEPFATLLLQLAASRQNMNTATNPGSRWLFPGRRAGQPLHPATMAALLGAFGIPTRAALTAALRQLVLQAPAPVVARALGYHHNTAHRHATQAGGRWASYAPGDHA